MNTNDSLTNFEAPKRAIKSYVCRSRMTSKQRGALDNHWSRYGINDIHQKINVTEVFARSAPTVLEIGFGMGNSLIQLAQTYPDKNFIGIEVHRPGIGATLRSIHECGLTNVRIICADAIQVLQKCLSPHSLLAALLFFPDPWPKRRHHKRRIVQPAFVELVHSTLIPGGYFHLATDVLEYAAHMDKVVNSHPGFHNSKVSDIHLQCMVRPKTKFELRGEGQGNIISDFIFIRNE